MTSSPRRRDPAAHFIIEHDSGEIWQCPLCNRCFRLIHRQTANGKPTSHRLEEISLEEFNALQFPPKPL